MCICLHLRAHVLKYLLIRFKHNCRLAASNRLVLIMHNSNKALNTRTGWKPLPHFRYWFQSCRICFVSVVNECPPALDSTSFYGNTLHFKDISAALIIISLHHDIKKHCNDFQGIACARSSRIYSNVVCIFGQCINISGGIHVIFRGHNLTQRAINLPGNALVTFTSN